jgi:hypothetical protein
MWNTLTRKSSAGIRSRAARRPRLGQSGQTMLEYLLIIAVVVSIFIVFARPFLKGLNKKFEDAGKSGFFAEDPSGSNFYYFPIR